MDQNAYIMHKPHPSNIIKGYIMRDILNFMIKIRLVPTYLFHIHVISEILNTNIVLKYACLCKISYS